MKNVYRKTVCVVACLALALSCSLDWNASKRGGIYIVSFYANGGCFDNNPQETMKSARMNKDDKLPEIIPTRAGYTFAGWETKEGFKITHELTYDDILEMTLYAKWKPE